MSKKLLVTSLVVILMLTVAVAASLAQRGMGKTGNYTPIWDRPGAAQELGLSQDQLTALRKSHQTFQDERLRIRNSINTARLELDALLNADNVDADAVRDKTEQLQDLKADLENKRVEHQLDLREILTAEQYRKLEEMRDQWRNMRRGNRGQGRGQGYGR